MMSPLLDPVLLHLGPVPLARSVLTSFGLTAILGGLAYLVQRRLTVQPGRVQALVELLVTTLQDQIGDVIHEAPQRYVPFLGTLFIYLLCANSLAAVPGLTPPTDRIETTSALALLVFASVYVYGIRAHGFLGYLKHFFSPSPLLFPIHVLSEITRTFALAMRLLGNIMSHGVVLGVVVSVAGLLVPVPLIAFGLFTGAVQAYIFTVLSTVYIAAAVAEPTADAPRIGKEGRA